MQNLNETAQRLIDDQFEGSLDMVTSRLQSAIRFFSTNSVTPEGELQHLQFQNSIGDLYLVTDILQRLGKA